MTEITRHFDTVSFCLSKGLGAPVGSVLVGDAATIAQARRWRKMLGGGMRQAGLLAAGGIHALKHHIQCLADDHRHATRLAAALSSLEGFKLKGPAATNMVFLDLPPARFSRLRTWLAEHSIIVSSQRLVLHRDVSESALDQVIQVCEHFQATGSQNPGGS